MSAAIRIARAGLNRFFDEGYKRWPEDKLKSLFGNRSLNDTDITNALEYWESEKWVDLPKNCNDYLVMLAKIPEK